MAERASTGIGPLGWLWRLLFAAVAVFSLANWIGGFSGIPTPISAGQTLGFEFGPSRAEGAGWIEVLRVVPGGPAEDAGIRRGDSLRFGKNVMEIDPWAPGERLTVQVARGDRRFTAELVAERTPEPEARSLYQVLGPVQSVVLLGIGAMLLLRGAGNRAAVLLSAVLLVQAANPSPELLPEAVQLPAVLILNVFLKIAIGMAWPLFCLEISGGRGARQTRLVMAVAGLSAIVAGFLRASQILLLPFETGYLYAGFVIAHQLFGYGVIAYNYPRNDPLARNRIKIVVVAFVCLLIGVVMVNATPGPWPSAGLTVLRIVAAGLLAYALLRQRLFDLNFVINRTLVYGAVSFILLAVFGLAEWAIKHTLPEAWTKQGEIYSAAIALALFLSFHRLRDWIDHHIERVFFRDWHLNEAALRRFVASAGAFQSASALCRAFAAEVTRFAQGAPAALYLREESGYRRVAGKLPGAGTRYGADEPSFALMRTEREPIELADVHSALPGTLALPLLDQGVLGGFVLLAAKPDGTHYRPDEKDVLGWAAQQIGLDLRAIQARELAHENLRLCEQVTALAEERDRLAAMLPAGDVRELRPSGASIWEGQRQMC